MRLPAPVSFSLQVLVGHWRIWLGLVWLPLAGAVAQLLLLEVSKGCTLQPNFCLPSAWPGWLVQLVRTWHFYVIVSIPILCLVPAMTALYRHLLSDEAQQGRPKLRFSEAELRYAGYQLLFFALMIILFDVLYGIVWLWPAALNLENTIVAAQANAWLALLNWNPDYPQSPFLSLLNYVQSPFALVTMLIILLLLARFFLILPHTAIGRRGDFFRLMAQCKGQVLSIVLALVVIRILGTLVEFAINIPGELLEVLAGYLGDEAKQAVGTVTWSAASFANEYLRAVGTAAVLAWFYRDLVLSRET